MSLPDFVEPEVARLQLRGNQFIDVRRELNAGEQRRLFASMVKDGATEAGERAKLDPERVGITRIMAYLLGWSFTDASGRPVPVCEAAVDNLTQDRYREISTAIDVHENEQESRRALEKKTQDGATGLRAIS